jgi:hypothetical protein
MARAITSLPNTIAPDTDYPGGRLKDKVGSNPGTRVNEPMVGDWSQFFDKIMRETGATYNNLPDNEYTGNQLYEALLNVFGGLRRTVVEIGSWNMDADALKLVNTDVAFSKLRNFSFMILNDAGDNAYFNGTTITGVVAQIECAGVASNSGGDVAIQLARTASGLFDSTTFDQTDVNRGYIVIEHLP